MGYQKLSALVSIQILLLCCFCYSISNEQRIKIRIRQIFNRRYSTNELLSSDENMCLKGVCVPNNLCVNGQVVTTGANIFVPRIGIATAFNDNDDNKYCKTGETCCEHSNDENINKEQNKASDDKIIIDDVEEPSFSINDVNTIDGDDEDEDEDEDDYDEYDYDDDDDENDNYDTPNYLPNCGVRNLNKMEPRIASDERAYNMEFPWMIIVLKKSHQGQFYDYQCGGSLIHESAVLTVAHCVDQLKPNQMYIRAGEWDMTNVNEKLPHQDRDVQSIVIHRNYDKSTLINDIAILILKAPVTFKKNVNPICLPPVNYSFDNQRCIVSGWGKDSVEGRYQAVLKKVELPIIPFKTCELLFRKTVLGRYFRLNQSFLCAGTENGKDSCQGDGGSPLFCRIPDTSSTYYQAGIVAWGIGCNNHKVPGAYVNVSLFREWIDKVMHRMNFNTTSYVYVSY